MKLSIGLTLNKKISDSIVLPAFDPDFLTWASAVETAGHNFGSSAEAIATNKTAWSNWVIAQKNAASPIAGRTNWQQLTQAGEGYIQPLMGVSTFNVPSLFGGSTFTGFVSGDFNPLTGLKGGSGKGLFASSRNWDDTPLDDVSAGMWVTGAGGSGFNRILGTGTGGDAVDLGENTRSRCRRSALASTFGSAYNVGTFPRSAFLSRFMENEYSFHNGSQFTITGASVGREFLPVSFFSNELGTGNSTVRAGLAFYGRSIDLNAMNAACAALSGAIVWP